MFYGITAASFCQSLQKYLLAGAAVLKYKQLLTLMTEAHMENLTVNFQLPAAAVFVPLMLDDGHGDYNRSYEQYENNDIDYADYSTDHRDNNYRNFEKKT